MISQVLVLTSAGIILLLGLAHLIYTYFGNRLHPRDEELIVRLKNTPLVISRKTSAWGAWIGFNASHSLGAILFGMMFGFLAMTQPALLFHSAVLGLTGLVTLCAYLVLAKLYWFKIPLRGILLALIFYVAGFVVEKCHWFN